MTDQLEIKEAFKKIQDSICADLEALDGTAKFKEDLWNRPGGGGGRTRVILDGDILEKGGVNFSAVHGSTTPELKQQLKTEAEKFFATGVSIVVHPNHPRVPIIHMNIRYFQLEDGTAWFGGGIDLTPHYINPEDALEFHNRLKQICDQTNPKWYERYAAWADDYFYIPHRKETRGIGGVFFDHLKAGQDGASKSDIFNFTCNLGNSFAEIYASLVNKHRNEPRVESEREWQLLRRGRYVEFNLVHDRGTRFGLVSDGRTESILMSLPNTANWAYDHQPMVGTAEHETLNGLKKGKWRAHSSRSKTA
jgi:coproporphyrinogen III oxidase